MFKQIKDWKTTLLFVVLWGIIVISASKILQELKERKDNTLIRYGVTRVLVYKTKNNGYCVQTFTEKDDFTDCNSELNIVMKN